MDDKLYVVGGIDQSSLPLNSVEVFDLSTGDWSTIAPLPITMVAPGVEVVGDSLFVFGGYSRDNLGQAIFIVIVTWDPGVG
jgi:hypothetical protein